MTEQWFQYLKQSGAQLNGQTVIHFENAEQSQTLPENSIADLSYLGLLKISGQDAEQFLQGQFTNDIRQVNAEHSQLSAWCTPKGRMLVNFRVFKREAAYYLLLPQECIASIVKRLSMYLLRAKVEIETVSDNFVRLGLAGTESSQYLSTHLKQALPTTVNASLTHDNVTVLCVQESSPRYLIITDEKTAQTLWQQVTATVNPVSSTIWQLFDILAGLPQIVLATAELFVPQMVNLQVLGGISFKKGCYTGQEIVARMQYLATLKQRMYLVQIDTPIPPQAGEMIYSSEDEQAAGNIVNAQKHPDGRMLALAVLPIDLAEAGKVQLQQGTPLKLLALPYTIG
jgi:hypothetical protein